MTYHPLMYTLSEMQHRYMFIKLQYTVPRVLTKGRGGGEVTRSLKKVSFNHFTIPSDLAS